MKLVPFLFLVAVTSRLYAQDLNTVTDLQHASDIVRLNQTLIRLEQSETPSDTEVNNLIKQLWNRDDIRSIYFKTYLLYSTNKKIQDMITDFLESNGIVDVYSTLILNRYKMNKVPDSNNTIKYRYSLDNQIFDEGINYSLLIQRPYFDEQLIPIYPWNPYKEVRFYDTKTNDSATEGSKKTFLYGGGTNMLTIHIEHYNDPNKEQFNKLLTTNHINKKYNNLTTIDVSDRLYMKNFISQAILLVGSGPDLYFTESIENADSYLLIHDINGNTYRVNYFMNISRINNNYSIRTDLWRLLRLFCIMTIVNK